MEARSEALERLRLVVQAAGGVLSLHGVSSVVGRCQAAPEAHQGASSSAQARQARILEKSAARPWGGR